MADGSVAENVVFTAVLTFGLVGYGLAAYLYVVPALERLPTPSALVALLLPHAFRYQGLTFLLPGVVAPDLAADFAVPAAAGGLLAAGSAVGAIVALRTRSRLGIPLTWVATIVGTLDFAWAFLQVWLNGHAGQLGGGFYIPSIVVPALMVSHILVLRLLLKRA